MFFVLVVIAIGALLALWRDRIDQHYRELVPRLERGVIIGALAMLLWPAMDYGYQQTANVLFGRRRGLQLRLSLVIAPWALLLLFYFLRRLGKQGEMIGQISGVVSPRSPCCATSSSTTGGCACSASGPISCSWLLLTVLASVAVALIWLRRQQIPSAPA